MRIREWRAAVARAVAAANIVAASAVVNTPTADSFCSLRAFRGLTRCCRKFKRKQGAKIAGLI
jgi:hypothetical protein